MDSPWTRRALPGSRTVLAAAAVFAMFLLAACSFPSADGGVEVVLPPIPPSWTGLWEDGTPSWSLEVLREGRWMRLGSGLRAGDLLLVDGVSGPLEVLLALPEGGGSGLKPAGALLPLDARRGPGARPRVEPDFRGGWLAVAAAALLGTDASAAGRFDWGRLGDEATARLADPWACFPEGLAARIAEGGFSLRLVKPAPVWPLRLEGAFPCGSWLPESPFAPPVAVDGGALALELGEGLHHFYSARHRLALSVDGRGRAVWGILERGAQEGESVSFGASAGRLRSATMRTSIRITRPRM